MYIYNHLTHGHVHQHLHNQPHKVAGVAYRQTTLRIVQLVSPWSLVTLVLTLLSAYSWVDDRAGKKIKQQLKILIDAFGLHYLHCLLLHGTIVQVDIP